MEVRRVVDRFVDSVLATGFLGILFVCGCAGGASGGGGGDGPPPSVAIKSISVYYANNAALSLPFAIAGQPGFQLLVNGTGYTNSAVVQWNGNALPTLLGDSTDLAATVSDSLIAAPGKATITVSDSGATSNAVTLPIASPAAATAGVVAMVTVAPDGTSANGDSLVAPSISATGRYVAFQSNATNLASGPASGYQEIYERDTCVGAPPGCTSTTVRITVTVDGSPVNAHSRSSAISVDGRYVAFDSQATNILPGTSVCANNCVFLRDTCIGASGTCSPTTELISLASNGTPAGGADPSISPDGRFVAFDSLSPNIVTGDSGGTGEAFVRDTCIGATNCTPQNILVSTPSTGTQDNATTGLSAMSGTGRYLAFQSWASNILPNETNLPGDFWVDTCISGPPSCAPSTLRADLANDGSQPNNTVFTPMSPGLSSDGRIVAFGSGATNLVSTTVTGKGDVYARDTCTGAASGCTPSTSLVSFANDGSVGNCGSPGNAGGLSISADGRFVSFGSIATNLTPDDGFPACGWEDIFVRDTCFGVSSGCVASTVRVSVANSPNPGISGNAISSSSAMSSNGHYVVFISSATNFLSPPSNGHAMVYLAKTGF